MLRPFQIAFTVCMRSQGNPSHGSKQDGGVFLQLSPVTLIFLFKVYFITSVFVLFVYNMSAVTVQQLISILDEKLAPFSAKMNEIARSMEFINEKYEEIKSKCPYETICPPCSLSFQRPCKSVPN